jgi:hypothetical protein
MTIGRIRLSSVIAFIALRVSMVQTAAAQVDVLTQHKDDARSGTNLGETRSSLPMLMIGPLASVCSGL